eukprot:TRINITY_DN478_c0_g1_i1.p2 TRINITY_DN478_c0_g1~~TRINITY_DN478_c0_g1_i1.p2  ORF type:complete len:169 (+),score=83.22 TRINITY_DN478_c0_g1_i1:567-1073(+)
MSSRIQPSCSTAGICSSSKSPFLFSLLESATSSKMTKFLKTGKVVVILRGRYAGKKAVILKNFDEGTTDHTFGHAIVAGIERAPLKITKKMTKRTMLRRIRIKPFVKLVNFNHFMPTRYVFDIELKDVNKAAVKDLGRRKALRKAVRKTFEKRHRAGKNKWFFTKLRF